MLAVTTAMRGSRGRSGRRGLGGGTDAADSNTAEVASAVVRCRFGDCAAPGGSRTDAESGGSRWDRGQRIRSNWRWQIGWGGRQHLGSYRSRIAQAE